MLRCTALAVQLQRISYIWGVVAQRSDSMQVNFDSLPSLPLGSKSMLPECSGVYFVFGDGELQYVGKAENLRKRWRNHARRSEVECLEAPSIKWMPTKSDLLDSVEASVIARYQPALNTMGVSPSNRVNRDDALARIAKAFNLRRSEVVRHCRVAGVASRCLPVGSASALEDSEILQIYQLLIKAIGSKHWAFVAKNAEGLTSVEHAYIKAYGSAAYETSKTVAEAMARVESLSKSLNEAIANLSFELSTPRDAAISGQVAFIEAVIKSQRTIKNSESYEFPAQEKEEV